MLLRQRQEEFVGKSINALLEHDNTLGVAPTGAGKTIMLSAVIGRIIDSSPKFQSCVLAHRDELTNQNIKKFSKINPHITTSVFNAHSKSWEGQVTFAMVQTLSRKENLCNMPLMDLIVIDEAHHATARTYQDIIQHAKKVNPNVKLFGVTATPNRGDKTSLGHVFSNCGDQIKVDELIESGHLVKPRTFVIDLGDTREKLQALSTKNTGDYSEAEVASILDSIPLNSEVVRHWREKAGDRKTVVFCSTIEHAKHVTAAFNAQDVKAMLVTSENSSEYRSAVLKAVESGEVQVIVNVSILTEGWDFPPISCVVLLRQSSYKSTMVQMIGRGLRTLDDSLYTNTLKKDCIILDFGISSIIHGSLEQNINIASKEEGYKHCFKCKKKIPKREDRCPLCGCDLSRFTEIMEKAVEPQRVIENFKMSEIDLLKRLDFLWTDLKTKDKAMLASGFNSWCYLFKKDNKWAAVAGVTKQGLQTGCNIPTEVIYEGSKVEAMSVADDFLHKFEEDSTSRKVASWRELSASENQLKWLPDQYKKNDKLTKGDASNYLSFMFNAEPKLKEIGIYD